MLLEDRGWGELTSARMLLVVPLPTASQWSVDDTSGPWLVAEHERSESKLKLRSWSAPRLTRPEECEAQARRWDPELPAFGAEQLLDVRPLATPDGFRGWIAVYVDAAPGGITGAVVAFAAAVGRCVAVAYTTTAREPAAERAVGRRLALFAQRVAPGLRGVRVTERARPLRH